MATDAMTRPPNPAEAIRIGPGKLGLDDVIAVARDARAIAPISDELRARLEETASWVAQTVRSIVSARSSGSEPEAYYGINTGFGALAGRAALDSSYAIRVLGRNLIASHSVGVGPYFDLPVVRAALLIRAQSLAQGHSGVRPVIVEALCRMLNEKIYPAIPEQGSLGASGDLAPLAHLVLVMSSAPKRPPGAPDLHPDSSDGEAFVPAREGTGNSVLHLTEDYETGEQTLWQRVPGVEAMAKAGGKIELQAKEALALTNGSTFSAAIAVLALRDARNALAHAELAVAMTLEGVRGFRDPFFAHPHLARGHDSAEIFARHVLEYLRGSEFVDPGDLDTNPARIPPQDPYSIRCAPQVHGTIADTLELVGRWIEMEINAVTDNPLIFPALKRSYKALSGGNFHGEPVAMGMDFLSIAMTEMGSMSDRRMFAMMEYHPDRTHGLSSFLVREPPGMKGLNSGLMMLQATAASLVSECKVLAHPDSIDSIPSSGNQEDHVSMSLNAARHAREIVRNMETVIALEILCAAQAIYLQQTKLDHSSLRSGAGTGAACDLLRKNGILPLIQDRVLFPDIRTALRLLRSGDLLRTARAAAAEAAP